jgi:hypothetical protein
MSRLATLAEEAKRIQAEYQADFKRDQAAFKKDQAAFEKDQTTTFEEHQAAMKKLQADLDENQRRIAEMTNNIGKHGQTPQNDSSAQGSTQRPTATHNRHHNAFGSLFALIDEGVRQVDTMIAFLERNTLIQDAVTTVTDIVMESPDVRYCRDTIRSITAWMEGMVDKLQPSTKGDRPDKSGEQDTEDDPDKKDDSDKDDSVKQDDPNKEYDPIKNEEVDKQD